MSYISIFPDETCTDWDDAPTVGVGNRSGGNLPTLEISFSSAPSRARMTRIQFREVIRYDWTAQDQYYLATHGNDFEYGLIEIEASPEIVRILRESFASTLEDMDQIPGPQKGSGIRHYRIGFDEHGVYDVLCASVCDVHVEQGA